MAARGQLTILLALAAGLAAAPVQAITPAANAKVERIFAQWGAQTPGCAVGVMEKGKPVLARDGKLSLDDPVRKTIPELPDYGTPPTIRQMLNHTSGLRDWGEVAEIGGAPRGSRVYTNAHVLDIMSHQSALNFTPGTGWSYSNTGYSLAAIIVERVSGMPFSQFTRRGAGPRLGHAIRTAAVTRGNLNA